MYSTVRNIASARTRLAVSFVAAAGILLAPGPAAAQNDPPSTLAGSRLSVDQVIQTAYDAGFRTETKLLSATSIAIAESSLWSQIRNWQPQYGYRPAADRIGVQGPSAAWNAAHTRQLNSDRGLWQISSRWWPQYSDAQADDPAQAARIVLTLSNGGTSFSRWDSFASGAAQRLWDRSYDGWPAIRPFVRRFLGGGGSTSPAPRPGQRTYTVRAGDTLYRLAARYYGDGSLWRRIAEANRITSTASIAVGQVLVIP